MENQDLEQLAIKARREYYKEWRAKNKDKVALANKKFRENNKNYWEKNRDKINAQQRERYHNSDKIKTTQKNWRDRNKDKIKAYNEKQYAKKEHNPKCGRPRHLREDLDEYNRNFAQRLYAILEEKHCTQAKLADAIDCNYLCGYDPRDQN